MAATSGDNGSGSGSDVVVVSVAGDGGGRVIVILAVMVGIGSRALQPKKLGGDSCGDSPNDISYIDGLGVRYLQISLV